MAAPMGLYLIETFPVGPLQCNCAILADPTSREAVVLDPGDEPDRILEALSGAGLKPIALVHTHAHFDHVGCSALLKRITGAPIYMHEGDRPLYQNLDEQGKAFGLVMDKPGIIDKLLVHGDTIPVGSGALHVLHTPGHTPGSLSFRMEGAEGDVLFSGDTLFRRSIGRTDLWGGSMETILDSIRREILTLPGSLRVVPGHGPDTTVAEEGRRNPFVGDPGYKPA
jgi:glyoxylase-like metal-dependent hydrolase (beta-lactamase superfamily II)